MSRFSIWSAPLAAVLSLGLMSGAQRYQLTSMSSTSPLEERLAANPMLSSRIQTLLPPGTSLQAAASGFSDEAQLIAALHVSRNLRIPFGPLKAGLVRRNQDSLVKAIRELRPELHASIVRNTVNRAEKQTRADLDACSGQSN